jgi:hypothetical protein
MGMLESANFFFSSQSHKMNHENLDYCIGYLYTHIAGSTEWHMPEQYQNGYYIGAMVLIGIIMFYFRKRRWF